jgi:riboflavin kinase/FMN adenylyltransferase
VGYDFGFGRGRSGNLDLLKELSTHAGMELHVTDAYKVGDVTCSSSQIREMLREGLVESAAELLGRPFFYRGLVTKGDGRGHKIGFPTANIAANGRVMVKNGVYATQVICRDGAHAAVTNIGLRPTFVQNGGVAIETHIFDFDRDIYGEVLEVRFKARLRDERKFAGVDELVTQIKKDVEAARALSQN